MKKHILKDNIVLFDNSEIKPTNDSFYDENRGLWIWNENGDVLVKSKNSSCPIKGTKKCDMETGEDLKGE